MRKPYVPLSAIRGMLWGTADGKWIYVRDLTDTHLANIIHHCQTVRGYPKTFVTWFKREARSRKLTEEFLNCAPFPWQNEKGQWLRLNPNNDEYEVIGR